MKTGFRRRNDARFEDLDFWTAEVIIKRLLTAYEADRSRTDLEANVHDELPRAISDVKRAVRNRMLGHVGQELARTSQGCATVEP